MCSFKTVYITDQYLWDGTEKKRLQIESKKEVVTVTQKNIYKLILGFLF